jgi:hypothetical protein
MMDQILADKPVPGVSEGEGAAGKKRRPKKTVKKSSRKLDTEPP